MEQLDQFVQVLASKGVVTTLIILFTAVVCRWTIRRFIIKNDALSPALKTRWGKLAKNLIIFLTIFALVLEWAPQLRTFALSLTAVAVAIVIALKEIILCFTGAIMRTSSSVKVGDTVEIQGSRGRAVELTLLTTIIVQLNDDDLPTGRRITLPNSVFLGSSFSSSKANAKLVPVNLMFSIEPDYAVALNLKKAIQKSLTSLWLELVEQGNPVYQSGSEYAESAGLEPQLKLLTASDAKLQLKIHFICDSEDKDFITDRIQTSFLDSMLTLTAHKKI